MKANKIPKNKIQKKKKKTKRRKREREREREKLTRLKTLKGSLSKN